MISNLEALEARDSLLYVVAQWPALQARLRTGGGNGLNGMPRGKTEPLVIDVYVSDLMREIEDKVARFYGQILMDETEWQPTTSAMPGLLAEVAHRYGHFTSEDDEMALGFCDDANEYRHRVRTALERPAPPTYVGPCASKGEDGTGCVGELYVGEHQTGGICRECGTEFTLATQRDFLRAELSTRLMTQTEILRGLKTIDRDRAPSTVSGWVKTGKLEPIEEGLYRFEDAMRLADLTTRGKVAA
jgi:hypothetical protein